MKARGKKFLSDSYDQNGRITWSVHTGGRFYLVEASITISDCSRDITLDFDCEKVRHIDKRINKLERLIIELEDVKLALVEAKNEFSKKKFYY